MELANIQNEVDPETVPRLENLRASSGCSENLGSCRKASKGESSPATSKSGLLDSNDIKEITALIIQELNK